MKLIKHYLIPILVLFSTGLFALALWLKLNPELALLASSAITLLCAHWLERVMPYRSTWNVNHADVKTDLASAGVLIAVIDPVIKALAPLAVIWLYGMLGWHSMLSATPLVLEITVVLLLVELGKYVAHRLHHSYKPLWWLHAMHHSSERMYWLNGLRFHPLNYTINFALSAFPAMLLGASPEALIGYLAITQPIVLIQHANIALEHRYLNWIFSTPEVHRWHHSTLPAEANRNYGNALLLWDHVFRSFKPAAGFDQSKRVGLFDQSKASYPSRASYLTQLRSMFKFPCCAG